MRKTWEQRFKSVLFGMVMGVVIPTLAMGQATLLPNAKQQYPTDAGVPVANGTVTYYVPGTSTKKNVWTDAAKTTLSPNPVLLDAAGRPQPTGQTFGDGTYRQKVVDANGTTIWDAVTTSTGGGSSSTTSTVGDGSIVGTVLPWTGLVAPPNYLFAYGQAILRATYPLLFTTTTIPINVICTSGLNVLSGITDTQNIRIGAPVEASCAPPGTTVTAIATTSVTISANATVSTSAVATFFPYGNGNGSTTFNVPDLRGYVVAGRNNMGGTASTGLTAPFYGTSPNAMGAPGGTQSQVLSLPNLPPYTPAGAITSTLTASTAVTPAATLTSVGGATDLNYLSLRNSANATAGTFSSPVTGTITSTYAGTPQGGTSLPFSLIQPTKTLNYIIKVLPDASASVVTGVGSLGGMTGVLACGAGLNCASQTVSTTIGEGADGYVLTGFGAGNPAVFAGFNQNGVSPTTRTPQNKMRDFVNLRDYGVEGDGTTDDGPKIQKAINSLLLTGGKNRILRVSEGLTGHVFQIGAEIVGIDNLRVECTPGMTFVSNSVIRSYFRFDGKTNVVFDGCTFDGNQPNLPVYTDEPNLNTKNAGISFATSQNLTVINSTFTNLYTRAIDLRTGSGGKVTIENNTFTSPTPNQAENYQHIDILTFNGSINIANNRFVNTAVTNKGYGANNIVISGQIGNVVIEDNYMDTCARTNTVTTHRLGCIDFYYDAENVTVRNNTVKGINWEFMRLSNAWPTDIYGNVVRMNSDAASGSVVSVEAFPFGFASDKGIKHVNIFDNKFFGSAVSASHEAIACYVYDYAFPCTDVKVNNNSFTDFYVALYVNGVYDGIQFNNNYVTGIWAGAVKVRGTALTALYGVTEANSFAGRLSINDNKFVQTVTALNLPPVDIDMTTGHTYTGTMGTYEMSRNDITGIANTSSAITALGGNSGPKGSLVTQQNNVTGYTTGQTLTNWATFGSRSNLFSGATNRTVQSAVTVYNDLDLNTSKVAIVGTAGGTQYNFNLPTTAGTSGDCMKSGGGGTTAMTWGGCISGLAAQAANTVLANATAGAAVPTAFAMPSCSTSASALTWVTNTGFGCNSSINAATLGGATFAAPGAIGGGTPSTGAFTTLSASTSITSPLHYGGSGAASTNTVASTSGAGTTDAIVFQTGSQIERARITTGGFFGVGPSTAAPDSLLTVNNNTGTTITPAGTSLLHLIGSDADGVDRLNIHTYNSAVPVIGTFVARGTQASKLAVNSGTNILAFGGSAWDGAAYGAAASIAFNTFNAQTGSDHSGYVVFSTVPSGSTTIAEAVRVQPSGGVSVGTTTDPGIGSVLANKTYGSVPTTFAALVTCNAAAKGFRAFITDELAAVAFNTIATGGGANNVPVFCDGTNWRIG